MSDFVDYEPKVQATAFRAPVGIRAAVPADVGALAAVMSVRGGASVDYVERAGRLIGHLPVLLMAEADRRAVGWCGIQKISIFPGVDPGWLIAGITVVPEQRRRGVAAQLLHGVVSATTDATPGEPVFSVINVGNQASIDL
ncbi:MAG: GNAT family N-acetyltransferase, partial [Micrococcaceae bacterium]|nr:GNAT family N-acetyltransferase [Micrococcaceae bacterium]